MGQSIQLTLPSGTLAAWQVEPADIPRGGVIIVQEIFGVTAHIRNVAEQYAAQGYLAIAPAFFDLVEPGVELAYDNPGMQRGRQLAEEVGLDRALEVIAVAAQTARNLIGDKPVGTVGYCWGGTVALRSAQCLSMPAVSYYGGRNTQFLDQPLQAPVQFHFGEQDAHITPDQVQAQREAWPEMDVFTYPADHAFNRDASPSVYDAPSAELAFGRALAFLRQHVG